jgi:hypothetical protein
MSILARICIGLIFSAFANAAEGQAQIEQKEGPAALLIQGEKIEDGRLELRLSSLLTVKISIEGPSTMEVELAKPNDLTQSKFWTVRSADEPVTVTLSGGKVRWRRTYTLDPQNKGDLPLLIAPLRYRAASGKGEWQTATWKEVVIRVTTTVQQVDPSQLRDITGPEPMPETKSPWIPVLRWSGAALVTLAIALLLLEWRRRQAKAAPELPPHEWAVRELARLESMGLPQHGQAERFHTLASDTIRRYLELRFQLRAPRQTTAEFLEAMREAPQLDVGQRTLLREFLERCDLAKFARAEYSEEECKGTADMARKFVDQTKPAPAPGPQNSAKS